MLSSLYRERSSVGGRDRVRPILQLLEFGVGPSIRSLFHLPLPTLQSRTLSALFDIKAGD